MQARRTWGSDGRSLGLNKDVDIVTSEGITFQVKKKKDFPKWIGVNGNTNYNIIQTDYKPPLIIIPLEEWLELKRSK